MIRYAVIFSLFCVFLAVAGTAAVDHFLSYKRYPRPHDDIVDAINEYREAFSLPALYNDTRLDCAAQAHAVDMAARRTCTSTGRLGETARKRAEDCQFPYFDGEMVIVCDTATLLEALRFKNAFSDTIHKSQYRYIGVGQSSFYFVVFFAT